MYLSVIIPVYNGEKSLSELYNKITQELDSLVSYEIIFIHDCGQDNSWTIISSIKKNNPDRVRAFRLKKNHGQHLAVLFGISKAEGDLIVTMDDDLQHDPADIIKLINRQKENDFDVVYGSYQVPNHSILRNIISGFIKKILAGTINGLYKDFSPFRLIKRDLALRIIDNKRASYFFVDGIIAELTKNISDVKVKHNKSLNSKSNYRWSGLFRHLLLIIIAYSKIIRNIFVASAILLLLSTGFLIIFFQNRNLNMFSDILFITAILGGVLFLKGWLLVIIKKRNDHKSVQIGLIEYTN